MPKKVVLSVTHTGSLPEPEICLICGVPAVFYDLEGNVIKREPVSLVYTYQVLFDSLCRCLAIRMGGRIRNEWDFRQEPFPFCESCETLMGSLVDVYRQVEQLETTVRNEGLKGASKFIPMSKFNERSQLFRNVFARFDRKRQSTSSSVKFNQRQRPSNSNSGKRITKRDNDSNQNSDNDDAEEILPFPPDNVGDEFSEPDGNQVEEYETADIVSNSRDSDCSEASDEDEWFPKPKSKKRPSQSTPQPKKVKHTNPSKKQKLETKFKKACTLCDKVFRDNRDVENHMRSEHGMEKLKCDLCENSYCSHRTLRYHKMRAHGIFEEGKEGGDDNPADSDASEGQSAKGSALRSKNGHIVKTKVCTFCSKTFPDNRELHNHMRSQHGMEKFKCNMCDNEYCQTRSLREHKQRAHGITGEDDVPEVPVPLSQEQKEFLCHICSEPFSQKETLKAHVISVHDCKYIIV